MATAPLSIAEGELTGVNASIEVTSPAFGADEPIPSQYTADGEGLSPPLEWRGVPKEAYAAFCKRVAAERLLDVPRRFEA